MLKDNGIKTRLSKVFTVMNKCIRRYLTDLDFPIHFVLDNEFNGVSFHYTRTSPMPPSLGTEGKDSWTCSGVNWSLRTL